MKTLFFLGNCLLIISIILLALVCYQAYRHIAHSQRQKRTIVGMTALAIIAILCISGNIFGYLFSTSFQYVSLFVFLVTSGAWFTSSTWRGNIDAKLHRQWFILSTIPFFVGFVVDVILLFYLMLSRT